MIAPPSIVSRATLELLRAVDGDCISGRRGRRFATAFTGLGRLHAQRIVEAVEVIEEADRAEQLDDLAFRVVGAEFGELLVSDGVGVAGYSLSQAQGGLFGGREVIAELPVG